MDEIKSARADFNLVSRLHDFELQMLKLATVIGHLTQLVENMKKDVYGEGTIAGVKADVNALKEEKANRKDINVWFIGAVTSLFTGIVVAVITFLMNFILK